MTWYPISNAPTQYVNATGVPYSGAVLKAYDEGTTSVKTMATSHTGGTTATSFVLNASGYPTYSGTIVIPHVGGNYKLALYPTQAAADANSGAVWTVDNIKIVPTDLATKANIDAPDFTGETLTHTFTDNGATGVAHEMYHVSTSPAVNDTIYSQSFIARNSVAANVKYASYRVVIVDPNSGTEDAYIDFNTVVAGAFQTRMRVAQGLVVGFPTGDDKGAGTINAQAVYDDNTLLTCYPLEKYLTGSIDVTFWDSKSPTGTHAPARGFIEKLEKVNLLDIDEYVSDWTQKRALPAFYGFEVETKSTGEAIQRLMETVDIFAIHIAKLNERVKALESGE